ncbi:MAG TPA: protein-glutamate O-methyltransferase CheR [Candidatus Angelobacter sp.]|jgi:chemotaxis protein methyltransferase CheR|nr:protein-glutamate O-methyltransferase CheR [Candidatus Angelobacter sp.]
MAGGVVTVSEHELSEIRGLIETRSGILFDNSRERFFSTRVLEHVESRKLTHGTDLIRLIKNSNVEYDSLLQRLLTQETSFFRYPAVFEALEKKVLPDLHMKKFWESPRSLRIWSAGCATGEEAYSIAMTVADAIEFADAWNIHVLATDISRQALEHAEHGVYEPRDLETVTPRQREQYFSSVGDHCLVRPRIRNMVTFAPMNLAQVVYMGKFDCIFCMNVLIYFSEERQAQLIQRFYEYLEPGGYLFLGHAESINRADVKFDTHIYRDARIYQKPANLARPTVAQERA